MYERSGGSMSIEERLANRGATTHVESFVTGSRTARSPIQIAPRYGTLLSRSAYCLRRNALLGPKKIPSGKGGRLIRSDHGYEAEIVPHFQSAI